MLVLESCETRLIWACCWGYSECSWSYCFGSTCRHSVLYKDLNWSLLMSLLNFVPAASVFGSSWTDWQRIFAQTKPSGSIDYMICLPAHGAVIGAWFGAWPMPLDWERPWQEWPICITFGAIAGYLVALVASFTFVFLQGGQQHVRRD